MLRAAKPVMSTCSAEWPCTLPELPKKYWPRSVSHLESVTVAASVGRGRVRSRMVRVTPIVGCAETQRDAEIRWVGRRRNHAIEAWRRTDLLRRLEDQSNGSSGEELEVEMRDQQAEHHDRP